MNCKIIKVHTNDIKDKSFKNLYTGGVPAFRILKRNGNSYQLYNIKNNKYNYSVDGFAAQNYNNNKNNYLSTKNTLIDWINMVSKTPMKENYNNIINELDSPRIKGNLKVLAADTQGKQYISK
jgi:hypothetical protein